MLRTAWQRLTALLAAIANWRYFKPAVFVACALPLGILLFKFCQLLLWNQADALGIDPIKTLEHETGEDALAVLLVTLSVTPVRRLFKINRVQIVRRMLGVWAFAYAMIHVTTYLVFDQNCYSFSACQYADVWADLIKRKFIFIGMVAFTIMLALAITSTSGWVRRLKKNWVTLHRLVYVAAIAAVIHFIWIQKADISEPLNWAYWLTGLLAIRLFFAWQKRQSRPAARRPAAG
jgi:sulfoxide reductase heme-binding subunit YedZ